VSSVWLIRPLITFFIYRHSYFSGRIVHDILYIFRVFSDPHLPSLKIIFQFGFRFITIDPISIQCLNGPTFRYLLVEKGIRILVVQCHETPSVFFMRDLWRNRIAFISFRFIWSIYQLFQRGWYIQRAHRYGSLLHFLAYERCCHPGKWTLCPAHFTRVKISFAVESPWND
jgi:hypothetical protein